MPGSAVSRKRWKICAVSERSKVIRQNWKEFNGVQMVVFPISSGWIGTWWYARTQIVYLAYVRTMGYLMVCKCLFASYNQILLWLLHIFPAVDNEDGALDCLYWRFYALCSEAVFPRKFQKLAIVETVKVIGEIYCRFVPQTRWNASREKRLQLYTIGVLPSIQCFVLMSASKINFWRKFAPIMGRETSAMWQYPDIFPRRSKSKFINCSRYVFMTALLAAKSLY